MIVLRSTYTRPLDEVDRLRADHVDWLNGLVEQGTVLAAGRMEPPSGAVVLVAGGDGKAALELFEQDPYVRGGVAQYETLVCFTPGVAVPALRDLDPA